MSERDSMEQQARKGFQAVQDAVGSVAGAAEDMTRRASETARTVVNDAAATAGSEATRAFTEQLLDGMQRQAQQQYQMATEVGIAQARAYNELVTASANLYLDATVRSWDYNRTVLDATGGVLADTIELQRRLVNEMSRTYERYVQALEEQYGNARR